MLHRMYYDTIGGAKKPHCKVISVGSIFAGGTGKTPLSDWIIKHLTHNGKKVVLLSRGYGRKTKEIVFVNPHGAGSESYDFKTIGDEPLMLKKRNPNVPIIVGRNRVQTAFLGYEKFKPDVILLDDGFQHRRLKKDIDITTVPVVDEMRYLWKREPLSSMKRASAVVIKGNQEQAEKWQRFNMDILAGFSYKPSAIYSFGEDKFYPVDFIKEKKTVVFCGIAGPKRFEDMLKENKAEIVQFFRFPDHYAYTDRDIEKIYRSAQKGQLILTTQKDGVRLPSSAQLLPVYILLVDVCWTFGKERFIEILA